MTANHERPAPSTGHRVADGDYGIVRHLLSLRTLRRKVGTLLPFYWPLPSRISALLLRMAGVRIRSTGHIFVGAGVWFDSSRPDLVTVGEHVIVGCAARILTHSTLGHLHGPGASRRTAPVTIGDGAVVGVGAILLPGVEIGTRAVVAAGAVVTRSVPPDTLVAGNPAQVVGPVQARARAAEV